MLLDITCKCWNISLLSKREKEKSIKKLINKFKKRTNDVQLTKRLNEDILGLMKAKYDLYPNISLPIAYAKIEKENRSSYKITASFLRKTLEH